MRHPPGTLERILLTLCAQRPPVPRRDLTPAEWDLLMRAHKKHHALNPAEAIPFGVWRAGHRRPHIAAAMRASTMPVIRQAAATFDARDAAQAINRAAGIP